MVNSAKLEFIGLFKLWLYKVRWKKGYTFYCLSVHSETLKIEYEEKSDVKDSIKSIDSLLRHLLLTRHANMASYIELGMKLRSKWKV